MYKINLNSVGGICQGILKKYEAVFIEISDYETVVIDTRNSKMYFTNMNRVETEELVDDIKKSIFPINMCKKIFTWLSEEDLIISYDQFNIEKIYLEAVEKNLIVDVITGYDDEILTKLESELHLNLVV